MTSRTPRPLVALLALLLLGSGVLAALPAQAERYIHHDASRDVRKVRIMTIGDDGDLVRAPHRKQGDYVKVKVWHQVRAVRVVGKFRQLDRRGFMSQLVIIKTPKGFGLFSVDAGPGQWKGVAEEDGDPGAPHCVIGHKVNYKRDRFSMRISRACLGRPAWVRVATAFVTADRRAVAIDEPMKKGLKRMIGFTPRLVHGDPR